MPNSRAVSTFMACVLLTGASACSETGQQNIFEPEVGHSSKWFADHGSAALSQGDSCPDCHGADLGGGVSGLSCFTLSFSDGSCHESGGDVRHTEGWELPREHGRAAMSRPGVSTGMGSCQACHGLAYEGGTSKIACSSCHGIKAPHPAGPWLDGFTSHDNTNDLNAEFCIDCHRNEKSKDLPGCYNGSLCHGEKGVHSKDWALPENHGTAAVDDPLLRGMEECAICHGEDFSGGTSGVSCFPCHGIEAAHGERQWREGGEAHQGVHEGNAAACAVCHAEMSAPPDCFAANACHNAPVDGADPLPLSDDPPPAEEIPPPEETPPDDSAGPPDPAP